MEFFFSALSALKNCLPFTCIFSENIITKMQVTRQILLAFSVTPFKIDQRKNQNRSIDKVQNLGNERRYIYKDPRPDSEQRNISYTRCPKKCFTQTYRDLYGDTMLVLTWMSSNMADGNQQKHLLPSVNLFFEKLINIKVTLFLMHELFR